MEASRAPDGPRSTNAARAAEAPRSAEAARPRRTAEAASARPQQRPDEVAPTRPTPVGSTAARAHPVRDPASDLVLNTPGGGTPSLRPQKIVPNPPPPRAPRGITRSIASDELAPVVPTDLDDGESSGESTRLGNLADPSADLLAAMPVHHDRFEKDDGPSETIAAPGQLAGAAPPRSLSGLVKDLDDGPSEPSMKPPVLQSVSEVRRGLAAHLGDPDSREGDKDRLRNARSETTAPELSDLEAVQTPAYKPTPKTAGTEDTKRLGKEVVDAVFGQEETAGLLDAMDPEPFAPTPLRLDPSAPTGEAMMPLGVDVSFDNIPVTADVGDAPKHRLAVGARRFGAIAIDAAILAGLVVAPALFGVFGDAISNASLIEPDDVSALLVNGDLTLPLVFGVVLYLVYSVLAHVFGARTLGKLALGLRVVNTKDGARVTPVRAILRAVFGLFGLLLGGVGYFWLLLDRRGRTLHDHFARTTVVVADRTK